MTPCTVCFKQYYTILKWAWITKETGPAGHVNRSPHHQPIINLFHICGSELDNFTKYRPKHDSVDILHYRSVTTLQMRTTETQELLRVYHKFVRVINSRPHALQQHKYHGEAHARVNNF